MNRWQVSRQMRFLLRSRRWEDDVNNELVFHKKSVLVSAGEVETIYGQIPRPFILIKPESGEGDEEEPDLKTTTFRLILVTSIQSGARGEDGMLGSNRGSSGQGGSSGRGLLEVEEEVLQTLKVLQIENGIENRVIGDKVGDIAIIDGIRHNFGNYDLEVRHHVERFYHPVTDLKITESGGTVTLVWENPPARFDRLNVVVRRVTGTSAPSGPTDGTDIPLGAPLDETVDDTPAPSTTYTYGLFGSYFEQSNDEPPLVSATADRFSDVEAKTIVVP